MNPVAEDILMHYGVKRRSGRYPWGSGDNPYQHSGDFLSRAQQLKKEGLSEQEIVKALGFEKSTDYRAAYRIAAHERRRNMVDTAKALSEDGLGATEIGRKLAERYGLDKPVSESTVRSYLNPDAEANMNKAEKTAEKLREELKTKKMIDVGTGAELELGVTRNKLDEAIDILAYEGYNVIGTTVPQVNNSKKRTTVKVLCEPGDYKTQQREIYQDPSKIQSLGDYYTVDSGERWYKREYPASISSDRVKIRYGDEGPAGQTGANKDGVIELRRGVADLDLGNSHYAQVRILVDGTHYLKGMAMYSDDIPDGVDIVFNTNKKTGTPKMDVLKKIQDDPDNPFGAYIKAEGQSYYDDPKGTYINPKTGNKAKLSAINKLKEEGDYDDMSRNLSSQFLSKQPLPLIQKQLKLTYSDYEAEYEDIMKCSNPTLRKKLLYDFAGECDSAVVHMKAAALPRQATRVILPVTQLKDTECYAPYLNNGEKVVLIRYPHGGTFEIPELTVNNKNKAARDILGNARDAIGINSKVAERLSGADFDGDTVVVIPVNNRVRIKSTPALEGLKNFDPKDQYATTKKIEKNRKGEEVEVYYNSSGTRVKLMSEKYKQQQMGVVSNLITDMTLAGAPTSDIVKAVRHSMVVIDAVKHKLDYRQSERDNDIEELKKKWQPKYDDNGNLISYGGANTLISRHKQTIDIPERRGAPKIDRETGEVSYSTSDRTYISKKTGQVVAAITKSPLLIETKDLRDISSGTPQEDLYSEYGNKMKALANRARKEYMNSGDIKYSPSAAKTYAPEVAALNEKIKTARMNAPRERRAQALANTTVKAKIEANPDLARDENKKELAKVRNYALEDARASVGASGRKREIEITDREWEAIQAGAISATKMREVLRYTNQDKLRERAMPRATTTLSSVKLTRLKNLRDSGYTIAEIAKALNVSTSTVSKYINEQ